METRAAQPPTTPRSMPPPGTAERPRLFGLGSRGRLERVLTAEAHTQRSQRHQRIVRHHGERSSAQGCTARSECPTGRQGARRGTLHTACVECAQARVGRRVRGRRRWGRWRQGQPQEHREDSSRTRSCSALLPWQRWHPTSLHQRAAAGTDLLAVGQLPYTVNTDPAAKFDAPRLAYRVTELTALVFRHRLAQLPTMWWVMSPSVAPLDANASLWNVVP